MMTSSTAQMRQRIWRIISSSIRGCSSLPHRLRRAGDHQLGGEIRPICSYRKSGPMKTITLAGMIAGLKLRLADTKTDQKMNDWLLSDWWKNYEAMEVELLPMLRASLIRKLRNTESHLYLSPMTVRRTTTPF